MANVIIWRCIFLYCAPRNIICTWEWDWEWDDRTGQFAFGNRKIYFCINFKCVECYNMKIYVRRVICWSWYCIKIAKLLSGHGVMNWNTHLSLHHVHTSGLLQAAAGGHSWGRKIVLRFMIQDQYNFNIWCKNLIANWPIDQHFNCWFTCLVLLIIIGQHLHSRAFARIARSPAPETWHRKKKFMKEQTQLSIRAHCVPAHVQPWS